MSFDIDDAIGIILTRLCTSMSYDKAASLAALYVADLKHIEQIKEFIHNCGRRVAALKFVCNGLYIHDYGHTYRMHHGLLWNQMNPMSLNDVIHQVETSNATDMGSLRDVDTELTSAFVEVVPYLYNTSVSLHYACPIMGNEVNMTLFDKDGNGDCLWSSFSIGSYIDKGSISELRHICHHIDDVLYKRRMSDMQHLIEDF